MISISTLVLLTQLLAYYLIYDALNNLTVTMSGAYIIWLLPRSNNYIRIPKFGWVLLEVRTPVWTTCIMRHWKKIIKITGDTDYYYSCIIKLSCLPLVYYFCAIVIIPDILVYLTILAWLTHFSIYNDNIRNICYLITLLFGYWY